MLDLKVSFHFFYFFIYLFFIFIFILFFFNLSCFVFLRAHFDWPITKLWTLKHTHVQKRSYIFYINLYGCVKIVYICKTNTITWFTRHDMDLHGFTIITLTMLHIYTSVSILRQKEELWKLKYFTMQKL